MTERQRAEIPRASGVYQILCRPTGKVYVGSAVNLNERWRAHVSMLRRGVHTNLYLQHAWDKYGEEYFEFWVIDFVERDRLLIVEQYWIDQREAVNSAKGFNIFATAGSPGGMYAQTWEGFIDPDGNEVVITNLAEFCRQNNLSVRCMMSLADEKKKHKGHKGWSHRNSVRQRPYIKTHNGYIRPDGQFEPPITNLAAFCKEHGLDATHMVALAKGRICSYRGWTHINSREKQENTVVVPKTYTGFINPQGERVIITNLRAFCRKHGLNVVHMHNLKNGTRNIHKGWTWRPEGEDDDQTSS
jgi:group I intron endonuclease